MKKITSLISITALAISMTGIIPVTAGAEENIIYGTMNIPYSDFYRAELSGSKNEYEVDAVSSATTTKWAKNGAGELFEGTYNQANADGTGTILGVTYPVAVTQSELDSLGGNNYNFTAIDYVPSAYKTVTVTDGKAVFSAVQDTTPETVSEASIKLSTNTAWGDYLIDVENAPETGAIYGAMIKTSDGNIYAMGHEVNIWRGELAWSSGIKTTEPHGNTLPYENFVSLMGSTINEVSFITADGYVNIPTDTYVPVKFNGNIKISESTSGNGKTSFTTESFPADYEKAYSIADNFTVTDGEISYTDAMAGSYTLTISDSSGKYADMTADFVLSTDNMPAQYIGNGLLVKADNADKSDFENFISNISVVTVNGTDYSASGRGSTKIIGDDGKIDTSVSVQNKKIFDGQGTYNISVKATGYNKTLDFSFETDGNNSAPAPATTTTTANNNNNTTTTTAKSGTTSSSAGKESPKTGVAGVALPFAVIAVAVATAFTLKKKNK
ncbi:MAG: NPXTG-anchored protein [Ruminococcus sp.]|nr:NPXTG-anchored protein [Ruminococcus sp.]